MPPSPVLHPTLYCTAGDLVFSFTAPYSRKLAAPTDGTPLKHYNMDTAYDFANSHGMGVRAVGERVVNLFVPVQQV